MLIENKEEIIPRISIITVVYNGVSTLEATILSVLKQECKNVEYIIIDGGSTDGTIEIIQKYNHKISYWISEPDRGIYDAMNKGVGKASGDWIYFLGADDILSCNISVLVNTFSLGTLYYGQITYKETQILKRNKFNRFALIRHNVSHQAIFYPKTVFDSFTYDIKYKIYADWLLNYQCISLGKMKKRQIDHVIAIYNENGQSGQQKDQLFLDDQLMNTRKYLGLIPYIYALILFFILRKAKILIK